MLKGLFYIISILLLSVNGHLFAQEVKNDHKTVKDSLIKLKGEKPGEFKLKEVKVKGRHAPASNTHVITTLSSAALEKTRGGTLADALGKVAGLSILKTGSSIGKPVIHGLHSNRVLILNNGNRLEGQQWGAEHAPEIDPFIADRMHVIKGAESIRYGAEAIGGIIVVEPAVLRDTAGISGTVNLVGASNGRAATTAAMLTGGARSIPGFGWRVQGSYKKSGNVSTADYMLGNTGVRELNFSAAAGYKIGNAAYEAYYSQFSTELGILYSAHINTIDDINARIAVGRPVENYGFTYAISAPRQRIFHHLVKLKAHYDFSGNRELDLTYGFQKNHRKEFDFRRGDRESLPITDLVLNTHTIDAKLDVRGEKGNIRSYGFNGIMQVNNNIPGTLANTFIPNFDSFTTGLYFIQRWVKEDYELEAGLRYDYKRFDAAGFRYSYNTAENPTTEIAEEYYGGQNNFHNVTGSAGAIWKINPSWQLASNIGLAWRAPTANELYSNGLHHGAGLFEIGNAGMKSEQGYKWITSLRHFNAIITFNLDAYIQYISNYIYSKPDLAFRRTVSGTYPVFRYQQTDATFIGADFSGTYNFHPAYTYQLNASVVRARDVSAKKYLPYVPSDRLMQTISYKIPLHQLKDSYLQAGHTYVRRQTRFEPESDYSPPPPAYHLFTLAAGTTIPFGQQQLITSITADNLLNTLYKDYMNRYRYYAHDLGRNITLRIAYKF